MIESAAALSPSPSLFNHVSPPLHSTCICTATCDHLDFLLFPELQAYLQLTNAI